MTCKRITFLLVLSLLSCGASHAMLRAVMNKRLLAGAGATAVIYITTDVADAVIEEFAEDVIEHTAKGVVMGVSRRLSNAVLEFCWPKSTDESLERGRFPGEDHQCFPEVDRPEE